MVCTMESLLAGFGMDHESESYRDCEQGEKSFTFVSGESWTKKANQQGKDAVFYKNFAEMVGSAELYRRLEALTPAKLEDKRQTPFFVYDVEKVQEAVENGRQTAVVGGPCLFGYDEVSVLITLKDGTEAVFDYSTGWGQDAEGMAQEDAPELAEFVRDHADEITGMEFRDEKERITTQELDCLQYPFEAAAALNAWLVIPLPDMSYCKHLAAVLEPLPNDGLREEILRDFRCVAHRIVDVYLDFIAEFSKGYPNVRYTVFHEREEEMCRTFYEKRRPFMERRKIQRIISSNPWKYESIKDYISMLALPYYLEGVTDILEVDVIDELDAYRKCRKAHKNVLNMGCLLYPDPVSRDGVNNIFYAARSHKEYVREGTD